MATMIKTRLIKIGNSQGIRIPKPLIEQVGFTEEIEVEVQEGQLIVRPVVSPRRGWEEQFQAMAAGDDRLIDGETFLLTQWEKDEWNW